MFCRKQQKIYQLAWKLLRVTYRWPNRKLNHLLPLHNPTLGILVADVDNLLEQPTVEQWQTEKSH
jgi:hypothetical protein